VKEELISKKGVTDKFAWDGVKAFWRKPREMKKATEEGISFSQ